MLKTLKNKLGILIPLAIVVLIFSKIFFSTSPVVGGDAPYYSSQLTREFLSAPSLWSYIGINFGGISPTLFLAPLMMLYSVLYQLLGVSQDITLRLYFYVPSILLSIFSSYFFARSYKANIVTASLVSLLYSINTYFILLIDGGQAGIALAYGIFPFALTTLSGFTHKPTLDSFTKTFLTLSLLVISDPRIATIAILSWLLLLIFRVNNLRLDRKIILNTVLLFIALVGINAYWLYPLVKLGQSSIGLSETGLSFFSLLNGLTFYQPHWPENVFGQVSQPQWYFLGLTLLLLVGVFLRPARDKYKVFIVYLIFVFLLKGNNAPLGSMYQWLQSLPYGIAFRDPSKFFAPVLLFGALLISQGANSIISKYKKYKLPVYFALASYFVFLAYPVYFNQMNFVLSNNVYSTRIEKIANTVSNSSEFTRTVWIPERHPQVLGGKNNQTLDGKKLPNFRALADLTAGSSDMFNYIYHDNNFADWYRFLGIDYIVTAGDSRNPELSSEQKQEWQRLILRLNQLNSIHKLSDDFYSVDESFPQLYYVAKIYAVVGPFINDPAGNYGYVYFEDGKIEPEVLEKLGSNSLQIVFNNKSRLDLTMSLLKKHFIAIQNTPENQWAYYPTSEYLLAKYQLLIREKQYNEFDYGLGFAMSDRVGEVVKTKITAMESTPGVLALRAAGNLEISINGTKTTHDFGQGYSWYIHHIDEKQGELDMQVKNQDGLSLLNTIAMIPQKDYEQAQSDAENLLNRFGYLEASELSVGQTLITPKQISYARKSTDMIELSLPGNEGFIVLSDNYNPLWELEVDGNKHKPLAYYSAFNAFYTDGQSKDATLSFSAYKDLKKGISISLITILIVPLLYVVKLTALKK